MSDILDFHDAVKAADDGAAVTAALKSILARQGFVGLNIGRILPSDCGVPTLADVHFDMPYADTYQSEGLIMQDPVVAAGLRRQGRPSAMHLDSVVWPEGSDTMRQIVEAEHVDAKLWFSLGSAREGVWLACAHANMSSRALRATVRTGRDLHGLAFALVLDRLDGFATDPELSLTPRERECLTHLAAGHRNTAIAHSLSVTETTVEMHIANARRKLGARTREQALVRALSAGLISP